MPLIPYILNGWLKKNAKVMNMKCPFKEKIKNARSMIIAEYFESIIEKEKPDIIHINGITYGNLLCANKAAKKYCTAYTLHGLSYKSNECSDFQKNIERADQIAIIREEAWTRNLFSPLEAFFRGNPCSPCRSSLRRGSYAAGSMP